jgi:hypothetical protein
VTFLGWPTRIELDDPNTADADTQGRRPAALRIGLHALPAWIRTWLGIDSERELGWRAWLGIPEQALLEVTQGAVYRDDSGEPSALRRQLAYFPRDVWLHKLACQRVRIGQEQAFVGRCADVGDDIGSRITAARLARDVMRLGFLVERRHAPYPKWFGTAFARLSCAPQIEPLISTALTVNEGRHRETAIAEACRRAAELHVALGNPGALRPRLMTYSELNRRTGDPPARTAIAPERDFTVINAAELAEAVRTGIEDREIASLAFTGGVDQFSDSADVLEWPRLTHRAAQAVNLDRETRNRPPCVWSRFLAAGAGRLRSKMARRHSAKAKEYCPSSSSVAPVSSLTTLGDSGTMRAWKLASVSSSISVNQSAGLFGEKCFLNPRRFTPWRRLHFPVMFADAASLFDK